MSKLAGGAEAVKDKRGQTEDIEMDGLRGGPAPEQHVNADAQIDKSDKPQALVDGSVLRLQNHLDIEPGRAVQINRLRNRPKDGVRRVTPDSAAKHLPAQGRDPCRRLVTYAEKDVAGTNSCAVPRGVCRYPLRSQSTICLDPPDAVSRDIQAILVLEVHRCQHTSRHRRQREDDGQNTSLGGVLHKTNQYISTSLTKPITSFNAAFRGHATVIPTENHNLSRISHKCLVISYVSY